MDTPAGKAQIRKFGFYDRCQIFPGISHGAVVAIVWVIHIGTVWPGADIGVNVKADKHICPVVNGNLRPLGQSEIGIALPGHNDFNPCIFFQLLFTVLADF